MKKKRGPWIITATRVAFRNPWITVRDDTLITPAGTAGTYATVIAKDGALVIPLDDQGNVSLIKEYKYPIDRSLIQAAGGGVEKNETPLQAARRELREEVGLTATRWTRLGFMYPSSSVVKSKTFLFLAEGLAKVAQHLEETEVIRVITVPFSKARAMIDDGTIVDGESIAAIVKVARLLSARSRR